MTGGRNKVEAVTREIRACFNRLKALGDALHDDLGVTASMRAVMEALHDGGAQTVPRIARAKSVTRQHIQVLANELVRVGLAVTRPNPADRRSPLVALSGRGREVFALMRRRERAVLKDLARALAACDVAATLAALRALRAFLDRKLQKEGFQ